ncbi:MAG: MBL fold metallo-hydrolase [Thermoleophilia bacterium]|nr:MBL fold metallo-hydrolase [Thermoleophilia bacterium]MDH5333918.1 MBL fold metallo-hydrolase [Thermoleophilia bacterium]
MVALPLGIRRVTLPLPFRLEHVHAYLLPGEDGWTIVDTGLGLPGARERWEEELRQLDGPVARIFVTHYHPDHVGAAADLAALTGATVLQGRRDYGQCALTWGTDRSAAVESWFLRHGMPEEAAAGLARETALARSVVHFVEDPELVDDGDDVGGWEVVASPGHADGQLTLLRDGVLVAGDHLLAPITPAIGLWPASSADPLGDYFASLERTIRLAPTVALPGHRDPIADPAARARELIVHHRERLDAALTAVQGRRRTAYDICADLFGSELTASDMRFAVTEALSHLERLAVEGRAASREDSGIVTYTAA